MIEERQNLVRALLEKQGLSASPAEVRGVTRRLERAYLNSVLDGAAPFTGPAPIAPKEVSRGEAQFG